jgi:hypothetical protein
MTRPQAVCVRFCLLLLASVALAACSTFEYHETKNVKIERLSDEQELLLDEDTLLDVGIVLLELQEVDLDTNETNYSSVRKSEAVWFTSQLKQTMESSNAWGLVRALPSKRLGVDVTISGTMIESNGEVVRLLIEAHDSRGQKWFAKEYFQRASSYAYNPEVDISGDPFQAVFNEIANDLFDYRANLTNDQLVEIRNLTKVLFAQDFVPSAFAGFVGENEDGTVGLIRIPALNDPMVQRVDRIRSRNDLFLDVVQDYYRSFNQKMEGPYQEWRKLSYKEVLLARQLKEEGRREKIAGVMAIVGGLAAASEGDRIATRAAGHVGIIAGAQIFGRSFIKTEQALSHSSRLRELGSSLESELEPSIVELQDRSVTLTGTVDDQYQEWRRILDEMFQIEDGVVTRDDSLNINDDPDENSTL